MQQTTTKLGRRTPINRPDKSVRANIVEGEPDVVLEDGVPAEPASSKKKNVEIRRPKKIRVKKLFGGRGGDRRNMKLRSKPHEAAVIQAQNVTCRSYTLPIEKHSQLFDVLPIALVQYWLSLYLRPSFVHVSPQESPNTVSENVPERSTPKTTGLTLWCLRCSGKRCRYC